MSGEIYLAKGQGRKASKGKYIRAFPLGPLLLGAGHVCGEAGGRGWQRPGGNTRGGTSGPPKTKVFYGSSQGSFVSVRTVQVSHFLPGLLILVRLPLFLQGLSKASDAVPTGCVLDVVLRRCSQWPCWRWGWSRWAPRCLQPRPCPHSVSRRFSEGVWWRCGVCLVGCR